MSVHRRLFWPVLLVASLCIAAPVRAADDADPDAARAALTALLGAGQTPLRATSGCAGEYGQRGRPRLADLLAAQLAYMHDGANTVSGRCKADHCRVEIQRRSGEDVSSATLAFRVTRGRLIPSSLRCVMTP